MRAALKHLLASQQEVLTAVPTGLPSDLLERRPDIRSAEATLQANGALVSVAKKAYFPRIGLTGNLGFQSNALSSLFTGASRAWTFIPVITAPIFTGGRLKSNVNFARAQQDLALVQIPANDSERVSRSVGRARTVSKGERGSRPAGTAGDCAARPLATGLSQVPGRRGLAAQRARFGS